ncbi:poly(ADP-ribose) polymerase catalytic domain-containing protein [Sarocladium implicatum]|nr:poly(ADP-ribose) polymerase catalytic domain-containing protein [Sarocladium implicatum]
MGLQAFQGDLAAAALSDPERHIDGIERGDCDEEFVLTYSHHLLGLPMKLRVMATDVMSYPDENDFVILTSGENPPMLIQSTIDKLNGRTFGKTAHQVIVQIARAITLALESEAETEIDETLPGLSTDALDSEVSDCETEYYEYEDEEPGSHTKHRTKASAPLSFKSLSKEARVRLHHDLQAALRAGVRPYLLGEDQVSSGSIIALSYAVTGLGIPSDTLEAWDLRPTDYIVLLMRLQGSYPSLNTFLEQDSEDDTIQFRLGRCEAPEPSLETAISAFSDNQAKSETEEQETVLPRQASDDFRLMYLFSPINELLQKHLSKLLRLRRKGNLSWDQAVEVIAGIANGSTWRAPTATTGMGGTKSPENDPVINSTVSQCLQQDFAMDKDENVSFPLVAMQFSLRRLARCTEFCMVCHCKVSSGYEAVKPFVCRAELCLYQYMELGFGRSLEHEIINHPYVVDLLISLFVTSVKERSYRSKDIPRALYFKAPRVGAMTQPDTPVSTWADFSTGHLWFSDEDELRARAFIPGLRFLIIPNSQAQPAQCGNALGDDSIDRHICQVIGEEEDKKLYKVICRLSASHTSMSSGAEVIPDIESGAPGWRQVAVWPFDTDIAKMDEDERDVATILVADSIPSVLDMRSYLLERPGRRLEHWARLDKSPRTLLNWIVASNRSYLVQDGPVPATTAANGATRPPDHKSNKERGITGLPQGWMQFRFQQGSPHKEQMYEEALQSLRADHPTRKPGTLYAWHGSHIGRWHNIIRQGLDFKETLNGRSYGNGVYLSHDFQVSLGYCRGTTRSQLWQNSVLFPSAAISVCEIINYPEKFKKRTPHLVLKQTDWIQCRYLLVKVDPDAVACLEPQPNPLGMVPHGYVHQDASRMLRNGVVPIDIPNFVSGRVATKARHGRSNSGNRSRAASVCPQVAADEEELSKALLFCGISEDSATGTPLSGASKRRRGSSVSSSERQAKKRSPRSGADSLTTAVTPFTPGTLERRSLPVMPKPSWSTSSPAAVRKLNQDIRDMQRTQSNTPLAVLGWYIDFDKMDNLFQWIVELHSFPQDLPLAQDMMSLGHESIVLEVRFGSMYPVIPPFVRVIRPTFVPFRRGGGGHVTEGGAICSELLTNSGWLPILSLENVLLSVRLGLSDDERPARLENRQSLSRSSYSIGAAVAAYERAARAHGWQLPQGFRNVMSM